MYTLCVHKNVHVFTPNNNLATARCQELCVEWTFSSYNALDRLQAAHFFGFSFEIVWPSERWKEKERHTFLESRTNWQNWPNARQCNFFFRLYRLVSVWCAHWSHSFWIENFYTILMWLSVLWTQHENVMYLFNKAHKKWNSKPAEREKKNSKKKNNTFTNSCNISIDSYGRQTVEYAIHSASPNLRPCQFV